MSERTSAEARGNTGEATAVSELANRVHDEFRIVDDNLQVLTFRN